jgi:hypothetical protein
MTTKQLSKRGRCSWGVICLNVLTGLFVILDLPFALTAPMFIGMTASGVGADAGWAVLLGLLMMLYPLLAIACIVWSVMRARARQANESLVFAILPYFVVIPILVVVIGTWK